MGKLYLYSTYFHTIKSCKVLTIKVSFKYQEKFLKGYRLLMKVRMYKNELLKEDSVDIHYKDMNTQIKEVLEICEKEFFKIEGTSKQEKYLIDINNIYYFDTVDKKSFAYLKNDVYQISYRLAEIEENLGEYGFVRISKSMIVNIYMINHMKAELNMRIEYEN